MEIVELWLRRRPRPASLKLTLPNGEVREMPTVAVRSWAGISSSIRALDPTTVEAFNPGKELLRVLTAEQMDDGADDESDEDEPVDQTPGATRLALQANDAETQRFAMVAQIVQDAYRHAAEQGTIRTDHAFARMVDLFDAVNQRNATFEKTLDHLVKLLNRQIEQQMDAIEEQQQNAATPTDPFSELVTAFQGGKAQATTTNGKGEHS